MKVLQIIECAEISAGLTKDQSLVATGIAFFIGGAVCASIANAIEPLATIIGTPIVALGLGIACKSPTLFIGTIICGSVGGVVSYSFSSTVFAAVGGFVVGGTLSAVETYHQVNKNTKLLH